MNNNYLANYGGPGIAYEDCWRDFTVWPLDLLQALQTNAITINSVIDFGAADGRWLLEFKELCGQSELRIKGIELVRDYFPTAADFVEQGRIQDWQAEQFDLAFITALGYLERSELDSFMEKLSTTCTYLVPHMECWDTWRFRKDGLAEPEEKTLWCLADWENFFASYGWQQIHADYFYIFKNTGRKPKLGREFLFRYLNAQSLLYENLELNYDQDGMLTIKGSPSANQVRIIKEQFVAKRFCFEHKPPLGKWFLSNGRWYSEIYDIY